MNELEFCMIRGKADFLVISKRDLSPDKKCYLCYQFDRSAGGLLSLGTISYARDG